MATKTINAIFFENASPLRYCKKCSRAPKQVKKFHFKTPIFSEKKPNSIPLLIVKMFLGTKKSECQKKFFLK